ncbi:MAG: hypothetical protein ABIP19_03210 [Dermatophilaceae bacterium]
MGFLDKAREAAQQATTKAQQGLAQGQAKLDEVQTSRAADGLLRELGAVFYAEQRSGGSHEAVLAALGAVDAHVAAHGTLDSGSGSSGSEPQFPDQRSTPDGSSAAGSTGGPSAGPAAGSPAAGPATPGTGPAASGGFTLDDM